MGAGVFNKLVLDQDGLLVGKRQIDASQDGVYFSGNGMFGADLVVTGNVVVGGTISTTANTVSYSPGMVIQTRYVRSDDRVTLSVPAGLTGTPISALNMSISPRFSNSMILCQWMITCEFQNDNNFLIFRNGVLASDGYNLQAGDIVGSGYVVMTYDVDNSSTPHNIKIMYAGFPGGTGLVTYGLAVRSADAGAKTFYLNRTVAGVGAGTQENGVSIGIIQEITQ
jgi:hypothetical protein